MATTTTPHQATEAGTAEGTVQDDRLFMTVEEVGRHLGVRRSQVYELAASGLLPVVRFGRRMRFPRRGLEQLAEEAVERARWARRPSTHRARRT